MNFRHISAFFAGVGIGAAIAAITTPKSGNQLRREANAMVNDGVQKVQCYLDDAKTTVNKQVNSVDVAVKAGVAAYKKANTVAATA